MNTNYIVVGAVESLTVSTALICTVGFTALFLKERIGVVKFVSVIVCIIGIFCITQPEFIFKNVNLGSLGDLQENWEDYDNVNINNETEPDNIQCVLIVRNLSHEIQIENSTTCSHLNKSVKYPNLKHTSQEYMGYILVIVYGFSQGLTVFLIRGTPIIEVSYDVQLLWSHIVGFLVSILFMFIFESPTLPDDIYNVMYLTGHVTLSFLATVTYFVALNFASGVLVTLNYSSGIVLSMLSQYFIVYNIHQDTEI